MAFGNFLASSFLVLGASMSPPAADQAVARNEVTQPVNYAPQSGQTLPLDIPTDVNGIETVCTGIDSDSRNNPRWAAYPLRLEFATGGRAYVSREQVRITGSAASLDVQCPGAWVLAKLPPGKYRVTATVESGVTKTANVSVPRRGQARVVLHFPEVPAGESNGAMGPNAPVPQPSYEPVKPSGTPQ